MIDSTSFVFGMVSGMLLMVVITFTYIYLVEKYTAPILTEVVCNIEDMPVIKRVERRSHRRVDI